MANKEALRALQQRLAERLQTVRQTAAERSWLAVEMGGAGFLLPLDQSGEIFPLSLIQAVPRSQAWFLGVANLRGQLHGVVDFAGMLGLRQGQAMLDLAGAVLDGSVEGLANAGRDGARLLAFNARLQINVALYVDRLLGLRHPESLQAMPASQDAGTHAPHFIARQWQDAQGRAWHELDLVALCRDEAFMHIAALGT